MPGKLPNGVNIFVTKMSMGMFKSTYRKADGKWAPDLGPFGTRAAARSAARGQRRREIGKPAYGGLK